MHTCRDSNTCAPSTRDRGRLQNRLSPMAERSLVCTGPYHPQVVPIPVLTGHAQRRGVSPRRNVGGAVEECPLTRPERTSQGVTCVCVCLSSEDERHSERTLPPALSVWGHKETKRNVTRSPKWTWVTGFLSGVGHKRKPCQGKNKAYIFLHWTEKCSCNDYQVKHQPLNCRKTDPLMQRV